MSRKLYKSFVVFLAVFGAVLLLVSITLAIHDSSQYRELPIEYREAVERLESGWHYQGLSSKQQAAIITVHKKWQSEGNLPWWGADPAVDPEVQKNETLKHFETFVVRWGSVLHQRQPFLAVLLSAGGFFPLLLFIGICWWVKWLRSPEKSAG